MTGTMNVPAEFLDKSHYFKHLAKEYHTPLDMVWALYKSEISEEEFYKCLETSKAAKLYGKGK